MIEVSRDIPNEMIFELQNGNTLRAERRDPYGHWFLVLSRGQLPEAFTGGYTTREEVRKAVSLYSQVRDIPLGPQPTRPEIKFKKVKNAPSSSNLD